MRERPLECTIEEVCQVLAGVHLVGRAEYVAFLSTGLQALESLGVVVVGYHPGGGGKR